MQTLTSPIPVRIMTARTEIPADGQVALRLGLARSPAAARVRSIRTMPLEERIQKSVDSALAGMRARIEDELRSMIDQIVTAAAAEREEAIAAAVQSAKAEAEVGVQERAAEAERIRASVDERVEHAVANERQTGAETLKAALESSRAALEQALSAAQQRADQAV